MTVISDLASEKLTKVKSSGSIVDLGLGVVLLIVVALLVGNVYIIYLARCYNDKACRDAILCAAAAIESGKDSEAIMRAAKEGLNGAGQGGFFIEHPTFIEFKDQMVGGARQLRVQTQTMARVPAPILLIDKGESEHGDLSIKQTYILEFDGKAP